MPTSPSVSAPQFLDHQRALSYRSLVAAPHGAVGLDLTGRLSPALLPELSHGGGLVFEGEWDASGPSPPADASTLSNGSYFIVKKAGGFALSGISQWTVLDLALWVVPAGSGGVGRWIKIDAGRHQLATVNGQRGFVDLTLAGVISGSTYLNAYQRLEGTIDAAIAGRIIPAGAISRSSIKSNFSANHWVPSTKFVNNTITWGKVDYNHFNIPFYTTKVPIIPEGEPGYTEAPSNFIYTPVYEAPAVPDITTRKLYHFETIAGTSNYNDPLLTLKVSYTGADDRVSKFVLPTDCVYRLPSGSTPDALSLNTLGLLGPPFTYGGTWDASTEQDPNVANSVPASQLVNGTYFIVSADEDLLAGSLAGSYPLTTYGDAVVKNWKRGDLALWNKYGNQGGGRWSKLRARGAPVCSVNGQGGDVDRANWGNGTSEPYINLRDGRSLLAAFDGLLETKYLADGTVAGVPAAAFYNYHFAEDPALPINLIDGATKFHPDFRFGVEHLIDGTIRADQIKQGNAPDERDPTKQTYGIVEPSHFVQDPFTTTSASGVVTPLTGAELETRKNQVRGLYANQSRFRTLTPPYAGGSTTIYNYDCEVTVVVRDLLQKKQDGTVVSAGPRNYYRFTNNGTSMYSTNTPNKERLEVMGMICVKFTLPIETKDPTTMFAHQWLSLGPNSKVFFGFYNAWGSLVFTKDIYGGYEINDGSRLGQIPWDLQNATNLNQGNTFTYNVTLTSSSFSRGAYAGGDITVQINCFPAPGEEILIDRLNFEYFVK